ncbi:MAG: hypothetical protein JXM79_14525 [Sedimentisphaerales bacterium]|nr:hypothetical protein [Sedimentisphaerales bacterium]
METYKKMNLKAENKAALLGILQSIDIVSPLMSGARSKKHTQPYAMAHLLSSLAEAHRLLTFPLEIIPRESPNDKPDFLLIMSGKKIGIEHTDARSKNETRKDALRRSEEIGGSIHFVTPVEPEEPERTAEELRDEIKANAHKCGWGDQDNTDQKWSDVMLNIIKKKEIKLQKPEFSRYDEDWLLIRDAWPFVSVNPENATRYLFSKIQTREVKLIFHRVFIISNSDKGPVGEVTQSEFCLHSRNDLWIRN